MYAIAPRSVNQPDQLASSIAAVLGQSDLVVYNFPIV